MLERVSLTAAYADRYPDQLSGGERQRVAIARALVSRPDVLVCDEVTSALDVLVQAAIVELLAELQRDLGLSMLFVTHNLPLVRSVAQRVAVMADGRIVEVGPTETVLTTPEQEYTKQLLADTPQIESRRPPASGGAVTPTPDFDVYPDGPAVTTARQLRPLGRGRGPTVCRPASTTSGCATTVRVTSACTRSPRSRRSSSSPPRPTTRPVGRAVSTTATLDVVWSVDGHRSCYHPGWLRAHSYDGAPADTGDERTVWDASTPGVPPTFDGPAVLADDEALLEWLVALRAFGVSRLRDVPPEPDVVGSVAARVGIVRETNFGVLWDVRSEPDPITNANTPLVAAAARRPRHTRIPARPAVPPLHRELCGRRPGRVPRRVPRRRDPARRAPGGLRGADLGAVAVGQPLEGQRLPLGVDTDRRRSVGARSSRCGSGTGCAPRSPLRSNGSKRPTSPTGGCSS